MCSVLNADGTVEVSLRDAPVPEPGPDEVLIRVEAAPVNPSDLGLLLAGADLSAATEAGTPEHPVVRAKVPDHILRASAGRLGEPLPAGNEGAGTVIAAGPSPGAQALIGRAVAAAGG